MNTEFIRYARVIQKLIGDIYGLHLADVECEWIATR